MKNKERMLLTATHSAEYYEKSVIDQMELTIRRLEDKAEELKGRVKDIKDNEQLDESRLAVGPIERVTWFVNDIENLMRNFDFNQIMGTTIKWATALQVLETLKEEEE